MSEIKEAAKQSAIVIGGGWLALGFLLSTLSTDSNKAIAQETWASVVKIERLAKQRTEDITQITPCRSLLSELPREKHNIAGVSISQKEQSGAYLCELTQHVAHPSPKAAKTFWLETPKLPHPNRSLRKVGDGKRRTDVVTILNLKSPASQLIEIANNNANANLNCGDTAFSSIAQRALDSPQTVSFNDAQKAIDALNECRTNHREATKRSFVSTLAGLPPRK